jgi:hypothetical protein
MTRTFLLATALSLAIAVGGLVWLDAGRAQASSYRDTAFAAGPVTDAEACSTTGYYNPGYVSEGGVIYVPQNTDVTGMTPYPGYPYYGYPYGYPGFPYVYPVVTYTAITLPGVYLPDYGSQAYLDGTVNNYACNAFSNCVPVASGEAAVCPGNPAGISLNSSLTSATCGSATNIDAKVVGPSTMIVADGTPVLFNTTLGMIPAMGSTTDGIASASLVFPPKTQGEATVTVTSGNAKAEVKIKVTC